MARLSPLRFATTLNHVAKFALDSNVTGGRPEVAVISESDRKAQDHRHIVEMFCITKLEPAERLTSFFSGDASALGTVRTRLIVLINK